MKKIDLQAQENLLLALAFLRRYGVCDGSKKAVSITGTDMHRRQEDVPHKEAFRQLLMGQSNIGEGRAHDILTGQMPSGSFSMQQAGTSIILHLLPADLSAGYDHCSAQAVFNFARRIQEKYPEVYAEYERLKQNPSTYFDTPLAAIEPRVELKQVEAALVAIIGKGDARIPEIIERLRNERTSVARQ